MFVFILMLFRLFRAAPLSNNESKWAQENLPVKFKACLQGVITSGELARLVRAHFSS